jgi:hypothetical protein
MPLSAVKTRTASERPGRQLHSHHRYKITNASNFTRRTLFHRVVTAIALMSILRRITSAQNQAPLALTLARSLNRIKFADLSPIAIKRPK